VADTLPGRSPAPLKIAISDCLLGRNVRYDGGSAESSFPHTLLQGLFEFRGICPEVGIGMGTPRDPIRLVGTPEQSRVVGAQDPNLDVTQQLSEFGAETAARLQDVAGYVFMKNSPSCGLYQVKVFPVSGAGAAIRGGRGAHAQALVAALPSLPVEENGRLNDPLLREIFVTRVFVYAHWQVCFADLATVTAARLIAFHVRYRYLLMAHSVSHCERADRLLGDLDQDRDPSATGADYLGELMSGLSIPAPRNGHANVLSHLRDEFRARMDAVSHRHLDVLISGYQRGEQPLSAPRTLLRHQLGRHPDQDLLFEAYLDPHPGYLDYPIPR
jgi:uncharacterized protein YbbK (DUF523 family)/uncharacterized protein YbgA (DUF1722 family)